MFLDGDATRLKAANSTINCPRTSNDCPRWNHECLKGNMNLGIASAAAVERTLQKSLNQLQYLPGVHWHGLCPAQNLTTLPGPVMNSSRNSIIGRLEKWNNNTNISSPCEMYLIWQTWWTLTTFKGRQELKRTLSFQDFNFQIPDIRY